MTFKEFDNFDWKLGVKVLYRGDERAVDSVDFAERLVGISSELDDEYEVNWVRCENVEIL